LSSTVSAFSFIGGYLGGIALSSAVLADAWLYFADVCAATALSQRHQLCLAVLADAWAAAALSAVLADAWAMCGRRLGVNSFIFSDISFVVGWRSPARQQLCRRRYWQMPVLYWQMSGQRRLYRRRHLLCR
jgi:hypothetical protein